MGTSYSLLGPHCLCQAITRYLPPPSRSTISILPLTPFQPATCALHSTQWWCQVFEVSEFGYRLTATLTPSASSMAIAMNEYGTLFFLREKVYTLLHLLLSCLSYSFSSAASPRGTNLRIAAYRTWCDVLSRYVPVHKKQLSLFLTLLFLYIIQDNRYKSSLLPLFVSDWIDGIDGIDLIGYIDWAFFKYRNIIIFSKGKLLVCSSHDRRSTCHCIIAKFHHLVTLQCDNGGVQTVLTNAAGPHNLSCFYHVLPPIPLLQSTYHSSLFLVKAVI